MSDLLNTLLIALVPVAIGALGYLGKQVIGYLKARMGAEQFTMVEALATTAVRSIEQTLKETANTEKRAAALALVKAECLKRGYKLDDAAIGAAIEAAVYKELTAAK
jgi:LL-H family phage holin